MEIPVFENDIQAGTLQVSPAGLYTLFTARIPAAGADDPGDHPNPVLSRLWLLNRKGNAASLGLLAPCSDGRVLSRRLSRLECGRLPPMPDRALVLPNGEKPKPSGKGEEVRPQSSPAGDGRGSFELRAPHTEFAWRLLSDGSMIEPKRRLLALPWAGEKLPEQARKIVVKGRQYLVFRY